MGEYLYNYLNNINFNILDYNNKLINKRCKICGGPFDGSTCRYCLEKDEELKKLEKELLNKIIELQQIIDKLNIESIDINQFFNNLLVIKNSKLDSNIINEINKLIQKVNYDKHYEVIKNKIKDNVKIEPLEEQYIISLIQETNSKQNDGINSIASEMFDLCNISILKQEKIINVELYKEVVISHLKNVLSLNRKNFNSFNTLEADFKFVSDEHECGHMENNTITINERLLEEYVNTSNKEFLKTLFHEFRHIEQKKIIDNKLITEDCLTWIKDEINSKYIPDYYKDNYEFFSEEVDARIAEEKEPIEYIERLGFNVSDKDKEEANQNIKKELKLKEINTRRINNEEKDIDEIFEQILIAHPELLNQYPQLRMEYKLDGNIVKLNFNEQMNLYEQIKNTEDYQNNKEMYDTLFKKNMVDKIFNSK